MIARLLAGVARPLHRGLLRLAPPDVRAQYRAEMGRTFDAMLDVASCHGSWAVLALLIREFIDILHARRSPAAAEALMSSHTDPEPRVWRAARLAQATRSLFRRPAFTATALFALAAGTAATTTVFAIVDTVVIKALPYPDADRLVNVQEASPAANARVSLVGPARLEDWQRMTRSFEAVSGYYSEAVTDTSVAQPERLDGRRVAPRFFTVFGTNPVVGRTFTDAEEHFGGPLAAVVSEQFWARRFQRNPQVIGRALMIGGQAFPIVGVMPAAFTSSVDVWLPAQFAPGLLAFRESRFLSGIGRMKPGVTLEQAHDDLDRVQRELGAQFPKTDAGWSVTLWDMKAFRLGDRSRGLWLVFGAVGLLWLIAMTNVAGLVLVETHRRARELAIRLAIGASRGHIVGVVVQEVLVVAMLGSALGTVVSIWLVGVVKSLFTTLPRVSELAIDWRAAAFAAITGIVAAGVCGLVPALVATRHRPASLVASGGRVVAGGAHRWQRGLVAAQVALSLLLSASAALLLRSYYNLTHVDPGFATEGTVTFHVGARWDEDRTRVGQLQASLLESLGRMPGVQAAGFVNFLPATGGTLRFSVRVEGLAGTDANGTMQTGQRTISPDYLRALGVPLVTGQWCRPISTDMNQRTGVLVSRSFVEKFAQGQNLIGRELTFPEFRTPNTIVGVVEDMAEDGPQAARAPYVYTCLAAGSWPDPNYVVRTNDVAGFIANLAPAVHQLDPSRAIFGVRPLGDVLHDAVEAPRLNAGMIGVFAGGALLLAAVGLYGLFTLLVSESRREIGVRLALGAAPRQVVQLVFADAGRLLGIGIVAGLALAILGNRTLGSMLFDVGPLDPMTLVTATLTLAAVAACAIAIPAIRAAHVPPTEALRTE
ncbi:MAG TPA: ADOP family duplicated permease [Vicinamibacterales bacterium]|nr:ADOP family duplicated permease [Vicinamibacterales bacterium]